MIKRVLALAAGALCFGALATPAQALTEVAPGDCGDGADWSWSVSNPARYGAGDHEIVVGLSEAKRTVVIHTPAGCTFDEGDRWQVYSSAGGFSADGVISASEDGATSDSDSVSVEVPSSNSVAGDDLLVHLRVSDPDTPGWEVDKSSSVPRVTLLRRALFKYHSTDDRVNFSEPYTCGDVIKGSGQLVRASWSSHSYVGYEGRTVRAEYRVDPLPYTGQFVDSDVTVAGGGLSFSFIAGDPGKTPCGPTVILRGNYAGNGTTSGNVSKGDAVAQAS